MSSLAPELKAAIFKENSKEIAKKEAVLSWKIIRDGLRTETLTAHEFLDHTRSLIDNMHALPRKNRKHIDKSYQDLRRHGKEFIQEQVKEALIEQISSGKNIRQQDMKLAEMLGLLGNRFGFGADKDVSVALGPDSPLARRRIQTGVGAVAAAGLAATGAPYAAEALALSLRIGKALPYLVEASVSKTELTAPQPKPNIQPARKPPPPVPSPSPAAAASPSPSPAASPEARNSPPAAATKAATATQETATPAPTSTLEPTPTSEPTSTPEPPTPTPEPVPELPEEPEVMAETETEEPNKENMVEIGSQNVAEFFLGQWILELKGKGSTLWNENESYRERVTKENAESDNITIVYLGTDNERDRDRHATTTSRSDVIIVEVFNPHTFQTTSISLNRDLFAPEVTAEYGGFDRINAATMLPAVKQGIDPYPLIQRMLESATGLRIDGIIQTNIDFVNGYDAYRDVFKGDQDGKNSVIDVSVPEGIEVNPPEVIDDPQYPKGFGIQHVRFEPGPQLLHGQDLVKYARARKGDGNNDYKRSERQREVAFKVLRSLSSKLVDDLEQGKTDTMDRTIEMFSEQQECGNLFQYDIDVIDMLSKINESVKQIMEMPNGKQIIAKLATNSMGNVARLLGAEAGKRYGVPLGDPANGFTSFGLSQERGGLLETYQGAVTKIIGSNPGHTISKLGNHISYWQPLRNKVAELIAA